MVKSKKTWKIKIIESFQKHWWKYLIILLACGLVFGGFKCKWGKVEIDKDPITPWKTKQELKK